MRNREIDFENLLKTQKDNVVEESATSTLDSGELWLQLLMSLTVMK